MFKWSLNSQDTIVTFVPLHLECKGDLNELKPLIGFRWCLWRWLKWVEAFNYINLSLKGNGNEIQDLCVFKGNHLKTLKDEYIKIMMNLVKISIFTWRLHIIHRVTGNSKFGGAGPLMAHCLRTFARKFSNSNFFLRLLPL